LTLSYPDYYSYTVPYIGYSESLTTNWGGYFTFSPQPSIPCNEGYVQLNTVDYATPTQRTLNICGNSSNVVITDTNSGITTAYSWSRIFHVRASNSLTFTAYFNTSGIGLTIDYWYDYTCDSYIPPTSSANCAAGCTFASGSNCGPTNVSYCVADFIDYAYDSTSYLYTTTNTLSCPVANVYASATSAPTYNYNYNGNNDNNSSPYSYTGWIVFCFVVILISFCYRIWRARNNRPAPLSGQMADPMRGNYVNVPVQNGRVNVPPQNGYYVPPVANGNPYNAPPQYKPSAPAAPPVYGESNVASSKTDPPAYLNDNHIPAAAKN